MKKGRRIIIKDATGKINYNNYNNIEVDVVKEFVCGFLVGNNSPNGKYYFQYSVTNGYSDTEVINFVF